MVRSSSNYFLIKFGEAGFLGAAPRYDMQRPVRNLYVSGTRRVQDWKLAVDSVVHGSGRFARYPENWLAIWRRKWKASNDVAAIGRSFS